MGQLTFPGEVERATSLLFVCLGNICRSPAAEGVMRRVVEAAGLGRVVHIDSAGTGDWHIGHLADPRMRKAAEARGYELEHRARQIQVQDFDRFSLIVTMDQSNYQNVSKLAPHDEAVIKIKTFTSFCSHHKIGEVPDPYYGSAKDFDHVLDILEDGCQGILHTITKEIGA
jgi:protein-tyrosine phosphatase